MSNELPEQLKVLKTEAENVENVTPEQESALKTLRGDIDRLLDENEEEHPQGLIERLEDAVVLFGSDHPEFAKAVNATLTMLANSGV